MSQQQEKKFTSKKKDEILKNLMLFNQKLLQDKKNVEGVIELSLHKGYKDRIVGSSYLAVPREHIYQAFELLLTQGGWSIRCRRFSVCTGCLERRYRNGIVLQFHAYYN